MQFINNIAVREKPVIKLTVVGKKNILNINHDKRRVT